MNKRVFLAGIFLILLISNLFSVSAITEEERIKNNQEINQQFNLISGSSSNLTGSPGENSLAAKPIPSYDILPPEVIITIILIIAGLIYYFISSTAGDRRV